MFAAEAKAITRNFGAKELIHNDTLNHKMDLLTLVKISEKKLWPVKKYQILFCTLPNLMEEEFSPDYTEEILMEKFMTTAQTSGGGGVGGGDGGLCKVEVTVNVDVVDGQAQPVDIMTRKVNLETMRKRLKDSTVKKDQVDELKLREKDKLAFVNQIIYNSAPVELSRTRAKDGCASVGYKMMNLSAKGQRKEKTSFTVPEKSTFAYSLVEIKIQDEKLRILCEPWTRCKVERLFCDAMSSGTIREVTEELEMKEALLQPLEDLPEPNRPDLLKTLSELVEDGDALSLLEQTLDQCSNETSVHPRSHAVSSFMDLLDVSNISTAVKDAVHLLVSALDALPGEMSPLLTSCSPDTLRVLSQLVDGLKDGQAKLPESLPAPLQEGGDLRWAAELICLNDKKLKELSDVWDRPELPPEVLLELLCLAVQGLSLMQPRTKP
ncbi:uncharacterized protein LOC115789015 [Archocentrus centrarchus]|uniref:uncharacterized protein LOC115789015 n=1 Tax=Archocentrus centrarchus TaxID=63155 RepID=UPI0011EA1F27|nr:uncharacterized protein LOC115789015 [Archocentrus centrarchus]